MSGLVQRTKSLIIGALVLLLVGCASTPNRRASRALHEGDYDRAIPLLTALALERPSHARTWAQLGEAQYFSEQYPDAKESFARALEQDPSLASTHLFLGYIAEKQDNPDQALFHYQAFLDGKPRGKAVKDVARRVEVLRQRRAESFARQAIANERDLRASSFSDSTVGVVYFNAGRLSEPLRPLVKGMAEMLVTDLSKIPGMRVVERLKTEKLLAELTLSQSSAFDTSSAPRLGKLLGAAHVLGGDASELSHGRLRFDPQMVRTTTGDVIIGDEQIGELAEFFRMEKDIVFNIAEQLGFTLSPAERDSIAGIPTESFVAFLAYSRGLDFQDRGDYGAARREFERAASLDPGFREASSKAREASLLSGLNPNDEPGDVDRFAAGTSEDKEWRESPVNTDERLSNLINNGGLMRPVGDDDPYTEPAGKSTIIINGTFDEDN